MSANTIEIKKRSSEEVACWKVAAEQVTPNTVVSAEQGVTVVLKINGQMKFIMGSEGAKVVNSLFNPGKGAKLFGGNKPYENVEIYAIDQTSEFFAEWGLAGNMAIPSYDHENDVHCNVVAFGEYFYKIENFANFIGTFSFDNGVVTRDDIREFLRAETAGVIKSYLTTKLNAYGLRKCQTMLEDFAEDLKDTINKHLDAKGLTVYNLVVLKLSYDPKHQSVIGIIDNAKLDVRVRQIRNVGDRDDLTVVRDAADIDIAIIRAEQGTDVNTNNNNGNNNNSQGHVIVCPRCGERNVNSNYCSKCGEKLVK